MAQKDSVTCLLKTNDIRLVDIDDDVHEGSEVQSGSNSKASHVAETGRLIVTCVRGRSWKLQQIYTTRNLIILWNNIFTHPGQSTDQETLKLSKFLPKTTKYWTFQIWSKSRKAMDSGYLQLGTWTNEHMLQLKPRACKWKVLYTHFSNADELAFP